MRYFKLSDFDCQETGNNEMSEEFLWYHSLWRLANEDVTKLDEVTKINFHKCLSALMYIKEKSNLQLARIKNKK